MKLLSIIYKNCVRLDKYPDIWKKFNICLIHRKNDAQILNSYRQVSLSNAFGKLFEKVILNSLFIYLDENKLLSVHLSCFCSNDLFLYQLLVTVLKYTQLLIQILGCVMYFWTYQGPLKKFSMKDYLIISNQLKYRVIGWNQLKKIPTWQALANFVKWSDIWLVTI